MVNSSYGNGNTYPDQSQEKPLLLSNTLVDEILARHDYPEDATNQLVSTKRRLQGVLTLHQQEYIASYFRCALSSVIDTEMIRNWLEDCWKKQEYSTGVKILLDNIDTVFSLETDECIKKYIEMMQTALGWKLVKRQRNNIQIVLELFQIRISERSQSTSPKTETTA